MYYVIDDNYKSKDFESFNDALDFSLDLALDKACNEGIDEDTIKTYVNGTPGPWYSSGSENGKTWKAGSCPCGNDGAYWPLVEWRN